MMLLVLQASIGYGMKMYESVADFYEGKSVFITGGTGFLGKVLIEKLLYSCPDIDKIYVLIRDHKGLNAEQRMQKVIDNPLFARLKEQRPNDLKKLIPVCGDIKLPNLGIRPQDEQNLIEKVSVVIHAAATVKFNEPMKLALNINVEGTRKILDLGHRMKKLEVLIHISTAYSNTDKKVVEEIVYPPPAELADVYAYIKQDGVDQTDDLLNGQPNTYTFTKALAETLVEKHHGNIPAIIVRPSIVTAILEDPVPGWICNWNGASGLVTSASKGLTRIIYADPKIILDLIPVDYVSNLIIAAGAKSDRSKSLAVYNCCSSDCNPLKLQDFFKQFTEVTIKHNTYVMPRPDLLIMTQCQWLVLLVTFLCQTIPAYVMDFWMLLQGKAACYVKLQNILSLNRDSLSFFTSHSWVMRTNAARALAASLSLTDCRQFPYRPQDINWIEYNFVYWAGIRKFVEKKSI